MRRQIRGLLAGSAAALAFVAACPAAAQEKIQLVLDWIPTGDYAPYYAGIANGLYASRGIDLKIVRSNGSGDAVIKVAGGAADIGMADISAVLTSRQKAATPVKAVATVFTNSAHSLFVLKDSGITDFHGLEGKRIGITPGNSHKLYFPQVAAKADTDPSKIQWVTVDGAAMASLLVSGRIDAAPFLATNWYYQNKQAKKYGKEIVVLPFSEQGFRIYGLTIVAADKTIAERGDMLRNFLAASKQAWEWAREHPEQACQAHVKFNPEVDLDDCMGNLRATLAYVLNDYSAEHGWGHFVDDRLKATYEAVAQAQDLDPAWNPRQAVDDTLLP